MDLTYTEEQTELRSTLTRLFSRDYDFDTRQDIVRSDTGWSTEVWEKLVGLGLTAIPFPEEVGGLDGTVIDLVAAAEIVGAHLVAEPWIPTVALAGGLLAAVLETDPAGGSDGRASGGDDAGRAATDDDAGRAAARSALERIAAGEATAALAHEEGRGTADPGLVQARAERSGDGYVLTGEKRMVLHGAAADLVVVTARLDGALALLLVEGPVPGATAFATVDGRPAAHLRFDGTPAVLLAADAEPLIRAGLDRAILVLAAEAVGALGSLLERTAEYAFTREQFGVPIGTFQSISHRLADMKIDYVKTRATLLYAAALAEAGRLTARDVSVLKAQVGRLGRRLGESAIQAHGGVGMTDELPIGHLHKRVLTIDGLFGTADYHLRVLGAPA